MLVFLKLSCPLLPSTSFHSPPLTLLHSPPLHYLLLSSPLSSPPLPSPLFPSPLLSSPLFFLPLLHFLKTEFLCVALCSPETQSVDQAGFLEICLLLPTECWD